MQSGSDSRLFRRAHNGTRAVEVRDKGYCRLMKMQCGEWVATSRPSCPIAIAWRARSAEEARRKFFATLYRWQRVQDTIALEQALQVIYQSEE